MKYSYDALGRKIYREEATFDIPKEELDKQNKGKGKEKRSEKAKGNSNSSKNNNKGIL